MLLIPFSSTKFNVLCRDSNVEQLIEMAPYNRSSFFKYVNMVLKNLRIAQINLLYNCWLFHENYQFFEGLGNTKIGGSFHSNFFSKIWNWRFLYWDFIYFMFSTSMLDYPLLRTFPSLSHPP
jgi:hypothetical protein